MLIFAGINYIAQLAVVIPATLSDKGEAVAVLNQASHCFFWFIDVAAYTAMGIAAFLHACPYIKVGLRESKDAAAP